jgi:GntP family gluconate:H+ symporter
VALAAGLPVETLVGSAQKASDSLVEKGFGGILGHVAPIIGLGTLHGSILEASGGAEVLTRSLLRAFGEISCGMRIAQGSATVAIVTTTGIVVPVVADLDYSQPQPALLVMAIAAGSIIASHVNDGGFWIVSRYFGLSVKETLQTWTVLETILSVVGFVVAALLNLVV